MNFGDKIQLQRKKKGMTQEELGEELNVSRQTITKWESNQSFPEIKKIIKLSYFFDVTIDYLLKDEIEDEERNVIKIEKDFFHKNKVANNSIDCFIGRYAYIICRFVYSSYNYY